MLGKNNFKERLRKMENQDKHDRFSIRKLSIGAASVLIGFAFMTGVGGHTALADPLTGSQEPAGVVEGTDGNQDQNSTADTNSTEGQATGQESQPANSDQHQSSAEGAQHNVGTERSAGNQAGEQHEAAHQPAGQQNDQAGQDQHQAPAEGAQHDAGSQAGEQHEAAHQPAGRQNGQTGQDQHQAPAEGAQHDAGNQAGEIAHQPAGQQNGQAAGQDSSSTNLDLSGRRAPSNLSPEDLSRLFGTMLFSNPTGNGGYTDTSKWGCLDMDNWHATVNGNYLDIDKYFPAIDRETDPHGSLNLGDNSNKRNTNIIIPNADDFAAHHTADNLSGTWRSGLKTHISSTVTEKIINELNPYSIAFSKTGNNQNTILKDNYNGGNYGAFAANRHSISNLTNFDGTNLDVSNIHDFGGMFINDSKLNDDSLKTIKGWDVSNRETLSIGNSFFGMFAGDTSLHDLTPLKIWKIGKNSRGSDDTTPINVASMFNFGPNDGKTIYADISKWNLKSVKNLVDGMDISGMYEMFDDSSNHAIRVNVENMPNWEWTKETLDGSAWGVPSINNESIFSHPASKNLIFLVHSAPLSPSIPPVLSPEPENTIKIGTVTTNSPVFVSDMNDIIDPVTNDRYSVESGEWYGVQNGKAVGLALAYARDILRTKIVNWHRNNTLQDKELLIDQSDQNDAIATLNANLEKQEIDGGLINTPVNSDPAIYAGIKARSERDTQTLSQLGSEAYKWQLENITSSGSVIPSSSATKKDGTLEYTGKVKSKFDPEKSVEVKVTVRVTGGREKLVSKKASEVGSIDNNGLNDWAKATIANAGSLESRTNHTDSWFADNTFQWVKENPSGSFNINGSNYSVIGSIDELLESINSSNPDFEVGTPSTYSTYSENPVSINGRNYNNVKKGYVMITYHKPNVADSEHPIVYSRQIVEVPVQIATEKDLNKAGVVATGSHLVNPGGGSGSQFTVSAGNNVYVHVNGTVPSVDQIVQVKDGRGNVVPSSDYTVSGWTAPSTAAAGDHDKHLTITYGDGSTDALNLTVHVLGATARNLTHDVYGGTTMPEAKEQISNNSTLSRYFGNGITYSWYKNAAATDAMTAADFNTAVTAGSSDNAWIKVDYGDGSTPQVVGLKLTLRGTGTPATDADNNTPGTVDTGSHPVDPSNPSGPQFTVSAGNNVYVHVNGTVPSVDQIVQVKDGRGNVVPSSDYTVSGWTAPSTAAAGNHDKHLTITYGDGSTDALNLTVHVLGATARNLTHDVYGGTTMPEAKEQISNNSTLSRYFGNGITYSWYKNAAATDAMTAADFNTAVTAGSSDNAWIKVDYGDGSTPQVVGLKLTLRGTGTPATDADNNTPGTVDTGSHPVDPSNPSGPQFTVSAGNNVYVHVNGTVPSVDQIVQVKDGRGNVVPSSDYTVSGWTAPSTAAAGDHDKHLTITYGDGSTDALNLTVHVLGATARNLTHDVYGGTTMPEAKEQISNNSTLSRYFGNGITYSWYKNAAATDAMTAADFNTAVTAGSSDNAWIKVDYGDGSTPQVVGLKLTLRGTGTPATDADNNTPGTVDTGSHPVDPSNPSGPQFTVSAGNNVYVHVNGTVPSVDQIVQVKDGRGNVVPSSDYTVSGWTAPSTAAAGNHDKHLTITYGDGSTDALNLTVHVLGATARNLTHDVYGGTTMPEAKEQISNNSTLSRYFGNGITYSWYKNAAATDAMTAADFNTAVTAGSSDNAWIKVDYGDGSTPQVVGLKLTLRGTGTPATDADNNTPGTVDTGSHPVDPSNPSGPQFTVSAGNNVYVHVNGTVPSVDQIVQVKDGRGNVVPSSDYTVSGWTAPSTAAAGDHDKHLTITYGDGSTDQVTVHVHVVDNSRPSAADDNTPGTVDTGSHPVDPSNPSGPQFTVEAGNNVTVPVGGTVPSVDQIVQVKDGRGNVVPSSDYTVSGWTAPSTAAAGDHDEHLTITYGDGSTDQVTVHVHVVDNSRPSAADDNTPGTVDTGSHPVDPSNPSGPQFTVEAGNNVTVPVGGTVPSVDQIVQVKDGRGNVVPSSDYTVSGWTAPSTAAAGDHDEHLTITYGDGSTDQVTVHVHVVDNSRPSDNNNNTSNNEIPAGPNSDYGSVTIIPNNTGTISTESNNTPVVTTVNDNIEPEAPEIPRVHQMLVLYIGKGGRIIKRAHITVAKGETDFKVLSKLATAKKKLPKGYKVTGKVKKVAKHLDVWVSKKGQPANKRAPRTKDVLYITKDGKIVKRTRITGSVSKLAKSKLPKGYKITGIDRVHNHYNVWIKKAGK